MSRVIPPSGTVLRSLPLRYQPYCTDSEDGKYTIGGFLRGNGLLWLSNGCDVKIYDVSNGHLVSSSNFSKIIREDVKIHTVVEYSIWDHSREKPEECKLCIVVHNTNQFPGKGYVSFCRFRTLRVLHMFHMSEKITSLCVIGSKGKKECSIRGILGLFSGALAIGTENGHVLIVDAKNHQIIRKLDARKREEVNELRLLTAGTEGRERDRLRVLKEEIGTVNDEEGQHSAILLKSSGKRREEHGEITALAYIPEGCLLAAGYESGAFDLWEITDGLECQHRAERPRPTAAPVKCFTFQRPCNDPKSCFYLWVTRDEDGESMPVSVMHYVIFKKMVADGDGGSGCIFKGFQSCKGMLQLGPDSRHGLRGRCLTACAVNDTSSGMLRQFKRGDDDDDDLARINLFFAFYECWGDDKGSVGDSKVLVMMFDMNQWYKAQMPNYTYGASSLKFVASRYLDNVPARANKLKDVAVKPHTVDQFLTFNTTDEYSRPSSISFDILTLTDTDVTELRVLGLQRDVLTRMTEDGPLNLVNPRRYYAECQKADLRPEFYGNSNDDPEGEGNSVHFQRNYLLTIMLEQKMSPFLASCAREWADGSRVISGCTLPNFICWLRECAKKIKTSTDKLCVPLFDYSGDNLDRITYQKFKHCCQLLRVAGDILKYIAKECDKYLMPDNGRKLGDFIKNLELVTRYFDVILWALDCGLLPEMGGLSLDSIPAYISHLQRYCVQTRSELAKLCARDSDDTYSDSNIFLIDACIESDPGGEMLKQQWENESGGHSNGQYPPSTLQCLLRMFLLPDLRLETKHLIMMYFNLDVYFYHGDERVKEKLTSYPSVFSINRKFHDFVEGLWMLDHEKYQEGINKLCDVSHLMNDKPWLHRSILKLLVTRHQYGLALRYHRFMALKLNELRDDKYCLKMLVLNGVTLEAYQMHRRSLLSRRVPLLRHFFACCDECGMLKELFRFSMSEEEEEEFERYLSERMDEDALDLRVLFALSRKRYMKAAEMNSDAKAKVNRKREPSTRDMLVEGFGKTLPSVMTRFADYCRREREKLAGYKVVLKPPLPMAAATNDKIPASDALTTPQRKRKLDETPFSRRNSEVEMKREMMGLEMKMMMEEVAEEQMVKRLRLEEDEDAEKGWEEKMLKESQLDVDELLRTPHVRKRAVYKSDATPLTSILKTPDVGKFKTPTKVVGFSLSEKSEPPSFESVPKSAPVRMVDAQTDVPTPYKLRRIAKHDNVVVECMSEDSFSEGSITSRKNDESKLAEESDGEEAGEMSALDLELEERMLDRPENPIAEQLEQPEEVKEESQDEDEEVRRYFISPEEENTKFRILRTSLDPCEQAMREDMMADRRMINDSKEEEVEVEYERVVYEAIPKEGEGHAFNEERVEDGGESDGSKTVRIAGMELEGEAIEMEDDEEIQDVESRDIQDVYMEQTVIRSEERVISDYHFELFRVERGFEQVSAEPNLPEEQTCRHLEAEVESSNSNREESGMEDIEMDEREYYEEEVSMRNEIAENLVDEVLGNVIREKMTGTIGENVGEEKNISVKEEDFSAEDDTSGEEMDEERSSGEESDEEGASGEEIDVKDSTSEQSSMTTSTSEVEVIDLVDSDDEEESEEEDVGDKDGERDFKPDIWDMIHSAGQEEGNEESDDAEKEIQVREAHDSEVGDEVESQRRDDFENNDDDETESDEYDDEIEIGGQRGVLQVIPEEKEEDLGAACNTIVLSSDEEEEQIKFIAKERIFDDVGSEEAPQLMESPDSEGVIILDDSGVDDTPQPQLVSTAVMSDVERHFDDIMMESMLERKAEGSQDETSMDEATPVHMMKSVSAAVDLKLEEIKSPPAARNDVESEAKVEFSQMESEAKVESSQMEADVEVGVEIDAAPVEAGLKPEAEVGSPPIEANLVEPGLEGEVVTSVKSEEIAEGRKKYDFRKRAKSVIENPSSSSEGDSDVERNRKNLKARKGALCTPPKKASLFVASTPLLPVVEEDEEVDVNEGNKWKTRLRVRTTLETGRKRRSGSEPVDSYKPPQRMKRSSSVGGKIGLRRSSCRKSTMPSKTLKALDVIMSDIETPDRPSRSWVRGEGRGGSSSSSADRLDSPAYNLRSESLRKLRSGSETSDVSEVGTPRRKNLTDEEKKVKKVGRPRKKL